MCGCGNDLCERTVSIMSITAASLLFCLSASLVYNCDWTTIQVDSCPHLFPYHCSLSLQQTHTHTSNVSPKCCISVQLQQLLTRATKDKQQRGAQGSVKDHVIAVILHCNVLSFLSLQFRHFQTLFLKRPNLHEV